MVLSLARGATDDAAKTAPEKNAATIAPPAALAKPTSAEVLKYSEILQQTPRDVPALYHRAAAYFSLQRYDDAIHDLTDLLEERPNQNDALLLRADAYAQKGGFAEALVDLDLLALIGTPKAEFYRVRGTIYIKTGEYEKALSDFNQALRVDPKNAEAENRLAWYLSVVPDQKLRDGRDAENHVEVAETLAENSDAFADTHAAVEAERGKFSEAIEREKTALAAAAPADKPEFQKRLDLYIGYRAYHLPPPDAAAVAWDRKRAACLDMVWTTVDQEYFDKDLAVDWHLMRDRYRLPLSNAQNDDQLRDVLQRMLGELHRTHFAIVPRSSAVFSPEERVRQGTVGARLAYVNEQVVIASVQSGSAAEKADLRPGDAIISLNGVTLASVQKSLETSGLSVARIGLYLKESLEGQLGGKVGTELKLIVQGTDQKERPITLKCAAFTGEWSEPVGNFPSEPIDLETRRQDDGIAYVRFNIFALPIVKPLKTFFRSLKPSDGLIVDLRGNPGGALIMASGLTGWLSAKEFSMGTVRLRDNSVTLDVYPQSRAFTGPIAVLIDGSSASTSEVFAGGLREMKRARIFGETSAGAALPSSYKRLPNDDLFQYAIGDIRTPGDHLLEGNGVKPDQSVPTTRDEYARKNDPVIAAATAWLNLERQSLNASIQPPMQTAAAPSMR